MHCNIDLRIEIQWTPMHKKTSQIILFWWSTQNWKRIEFPKHRQSEYVNNSSFLLGAEEVDYYEAGDESEPESDDLV